MNGPGRIIGVENGDPLDHDPSQASDRRAFGGLCLSLIQSTGEPGNITINASAEGLEPGIDVEIPAGVPAQLEPSGGPPCP